MFSSWYKKGRKAAILIRHHQNQGLTHLHWDTLASPGSQVDDILQMTVQNPDLVIDGASGDSISVSSNADGTVTVGTNNRSVVQPDFGLPGGDGPVTVGGEYTFDANYLTSITVKCGAGANTVEVESGLGSTTGDGGLANVPVNVNGGSGTTHLIVDNLTSAATGVSANISNQVVTYFEGLNQTLTYTVNYSGITSLDVIGDVYLPVQVDSTAVQTNITTGGQVFIGKLGHAGTIPKTVYGWDEYGVESSHSLAGIAANMDIVGASQVVIDGWADASSALTVTDKSVSFEGLEFDYSSLGSLAVVQGTGAKGGEGGSSTVTVTSVSGSTPVSIYNAGNDKHSGHAGEVKFAGLSLWDGFERLPQNIWTIPATVVSADPAPFVDVVDPALAVVDETFLSQGTPVQSTGIGTGMFDVNTGTWYLRNEQGPGAPDAARFAYGAPGWLPVQGHWNGALNTGIGVVDPSTATWYLRTQTSAGAPDVAAPFAYGAPGWIPVTGDWTGDGTTGIGMFDPATGTWYLRSTDSAGAPDITPFQFGAPGWIPVVGDWTGTGHTGIGVFDPATATFYLRNSASPGAADVTPFRYGAPGWKPLAGDWTGTGKATVAVVDPSGTWYIRASNSAGAPDVRPFAYGVGGWTPLAGDWRAGDVLKVRADGQGPGAAALSDSHLETTVAAALTRLETAGVAPNVLDRLASAHYELGTLPTGTLGLTYLAEDRVVLSADAAGHGWFVDPTPTPDEKFSAGANEALQAVPGGPAAGHVDLLTAVMQEMGQAAGLTGDLLTAPLAPGVRNVAALDEIFAAS
jgi:hypothetical protein